MNKKKEIIRTIRNFKRILKSGNVKTILVVSDWDIYIKTYTIEEIAARFLRIRNHAFCSLVGANGFPLTSNTKA